MGWSQLIAAVLGMLGGGMLGSSKTSGDTTGQTKDQADMQAQILDLLRSQKNDYLYAQPLRNHITDTADWLLPNQAMVMSQRGGGKRETITDPPIRDLPPTDPPTPPTDPNTGGGDTNPSEPPQKNQPQKNQASVLPPSAPAMDGLGFLAKYLAHNGVRM